jgi:hypothetical protein
MVVDVGRCLSFRWHVVRLNLKLGCWVLLPIILSAASISMMAVRAAAVLLSESWGDGIRVIAMTAR